MRTSIIKQIAILAAIGSLEANKERMRLIRCLPTSHQPRTSWNQRKARKLRRQRWAAGDRHAFKG